MAEEALEVNTNGKFKLPWAPIVGFLFAALLGVLQWVALEERTKFNERLGTLERSDAERRNEVTILQTLRPEDRRILESLQRGQEEQAKTQAEQGRLLAQIAERIGVAGDR